MSFSSDIKSVWFFLPGFSSSLTPVVSSDARNSDPNSPVSADPQVGGSVLQVLTQGSPVDPTGYKFGDSSPTPMFDDSLE